MDERELNLIRKLTWSFYKSSFTLTLDFDELFSEACVAYLEGEKQFIENDKTKKSTFLWTVMKNHLTDYINKEIRIRNGIIDFNPKTSFKEQKSLDIADIPEPTDYLPSRYKSTEAEVIANEEWEFIKSKMSPEAKAILQLILTNKDLYLETDKPKLCRGKIKQALRDSGWKYQSIWNGFRELKCLALL